MNTRTRVPENFISTLDIVDWCDRQHLPYNDDSFWRFIREQVLPGTDHSKYEVSKDVCRLGYLIHRIPDGRDRDPADGE